MPASVVRPEFGPTLPELLVPRLRALSRPAQSLVALAALALVGAVVWLAFLRPSGDHSYVARHPVAFNFIYSAPLRVVPARGDELVRLEQRQGSRFVQSMTVEPLRVPASSGDPSAALSVLAESVKTTIGARLTHYETGNEGRIRLNEAAAGYGFAFRAHLGKRRLYGRAALVAPTTSGGGQALLITLLATPAAKVPAVRVGAVGALKKPYHSFRFGTSRP
jgi:hypothetical protein